MSKIISNGLTQRSTFKAHAIKCTYMHYTHSNIAYQNTTINKHTYIHTSTSHMQTTITFMKP